MKVHKSSILLQLLNKHKPFYYLSGIRFYEQAIIKRHPFRKHNLPSCTLRNIYKSVIQDETRKITTKHVYTSPRYKTTRCIVNQMNHKFFPSRMLSCSNFFVAQPCLNFREWPPGCQPASWAVSGTARCWISKVRL